MHFSAHAENRECAAAQAISFAAKLSKAVWDGLAEKYVCKAKFVTAVASAVYSFKDYPTTDEYYQVAEEIVKKYPFMQSMDGHVSQQFDIIYNYTAREIIQFHKTCMLSCEYINNYVLRIYPFHAGLSCGVPQDAYELWPQACREEKGEKR